MPVYIQRKVEASFRNDRSRIAINSVIKNSYIRHLTYSEGPLAAALILGYVNLDTLNQDRIRATQRAFIFLNLRSGILFGLRVDGKIDNALTCLPTIADRLHGQPYDESKFSDIERLLNSDLTDCTVRLMRHAPICPDSDLCQTINRQYGAGQIKRLAKSEGIDGGDNTTSSIVIQKRECVVPACAALPEGILADLDWHFSTIYSVNNPDIIKFRQGLDSDALSMLPLISQSFSANAEQLIVYNWFVKNEPVKKRNRKQAVMQLLWLAPILTGLRDMPWMPERMCEVDLAFDRWHLERQVINDAIDAGSPLFKLVASLMKVPRSVISQCRYHALPEIETIPKGQVDVQLRVLTWVPPSMQPKTRADWSRLESQLTRYVKLIASAHRVPAFLILFDAKMRSVGERLISRESERILINWFRHDGQLHERGQFAKLDRLTADLSCANAFVFALANALDAALCRIYSKRRDTYLVHSSIMSAWLESSSIDNIAELSERWHRSLQGNQSEQFDKDHAAADEMPDDELAHGDNLAWQLIQTDRLGAKFRRAYLQHVGATA